MAKIRFEKGFTTGRNCRLEAIGRINGVGLKIGRNVQINDNVHIVVADTVIIGNDVLMASKIFISDCSHGRYIGEDQSDPDIPPSSRELYAEPVYIGDRVWIGDNVVVMPGVTIGNGSIIGASSVVVSDIPEECIAVGIPARVIKRWDRIMKKWVRHGGE